MAKLFQKAKPQPQPEASPEASLSLANRIKETCALTAAYIDAAVAKEKLAHPLISVDWIRMNMNLMYGKCACKCVLALMEKENNGQ